MNAVAFCLYGTNPKYLEGMLQNAWLMPRIYPGWECHCFYGFEVPLDTLERLIKLDVKLHPMCLKWAQRMFYRFLIHDIPGVERYLIRDADSRLNVREAWCVNEWIKAGTLLHTIHDHPYHIRPIIGGVWGIWRAADNITPCMQERIDAMQWPRTDRWGQDEDFLEVDIWPRYKHSCTQHGKVLPIKSIDPDDPDAFCCEIFDENGQPNQQHRAMRK